MLNLSQVTLWACVFSENAEYLDRTCRVIEYCRRLCTFGETILFSHLWPPHVPHNGQIVTCRMVQIPKMDLDNFNIFVNRIVPEFIKTDYAMQVHEDGFILEPDLWHPDFLKYDYIGAPWRDGVVGNQGFALESKKLLQAKAKLPFSERLPKPYDGQNHFPSDVFICRTHRAALESDGVRFAPRDLAMRFSTEQIGQNFRSFGFHGRAINPTSYRIGWNKIAASE